MDFFDALKRDHNQVKALCRRIGTAGGQSRAGNKLFGELFNMLEVHMQAEEHLFYARLQEDEKTEKFAIEGYEEHRIAKMLLNELQGQKLDASSWEVKFKVFTDIINHHIEEEEESFFEAGREIFEEDEIDELARIFTEQKRQLLSTGTRTRRPQAHQMRRAPARKKRRAA